DPMRDDDVGAIILDQGARGGHEIPDHRVLVGADVLELETGGAPARDPWFHAVEPGLRDLPGNDRLVIADDAEAVAELGGDVEHGLAGADHRDIDQRAAAVDPEVEGA